VGMTLPAHPSVAGCLRSAGVSCWQLLAGSFSEVYVFMDEVNTCPHMGLITEVSHRERQTDRQTDREKERQREAADRKGQRKQRQADRDRDRGGERSEERERVSITKALLACSDFEPNPLPSSTFHHHAHKANA
jgi:hypothetical protein